MDSIFKTELVLKDTVVWKPELNSKLISVVGEPLTLHGSRKAAKHRCWKGMPLTIHSSGKAASLIEQVWSMVGCNVNLLRGNRPSTEMTEMHRKCQVT